MKAFRIVNLFAAIIMVFAMLPQQQIALAQTSAADISRSTKYVPGEVVVDFGSGVSASSASSKAAALSGQVGATITRQSGSLALLSFSPNADVVALATQIQSSGQVYSAQPNYIYWSPEAVAQAQGKPVQTSGFTVKSDSGKSVKASGLSAKSSSKVITLSWDQVMAMRSVRKSGSKSLATPTFPSEMPTAWGWNQIGADLIWPNAASTSVMICELDTGVDGNQADLKGSVTNGPDEVNLDTIPNDDNGHGTAVAGVLIGKLNSGANTAAGVYNGKLEAVKVLNSQGYGTSYSVAAGVKFCTGLASVKVINMSLGTSLPDPIEYNVLLAAKTANKLIVAAAGNDSSSDYVYPAAWALQNVGKDGVYHLKPTDSDNTIYPNVIAVAGAGAPNSDNKIWVDSDPGGTQGTPPDSTELFNAEQCASSSTNYGDWISLVAPGEDILTTTPTSYPFNLQMAGVPSGYAYFSGTSMAAAYAAGAAARLWSLTPTQIGSAIKTQLVASGTALDASFVNDPTTNDPYAIEAYIYTGFDPTQGYTNPTTDVGHYGDVFDNTIYAPYCWPGWDPQSTPSQPAWVIDTSKAPNIGKDSQIANMEAAPTPVTYLNVAAAMNRTGLAAQALDAVTGQPLVGASITAGLKATTASTFTVKDTALVPSNGPSVMLINLPLNSASGPATQYQLNISKTGYTIGAQPFDLVTLDQTTYTIAGILWQDNYSKVSVPPSTNLNLVLDWNDPNTVHPNLDMYLWLPSAALGGGGGIIGHNPVSGNANGAADLSGQLDYSGLQLVNLSQFLGSGTLLAPATFGGQYSPYAIHNFNGEIQVDTSAAQDSNPAYYPAMESISILGDPLSKPTVKAPLLKPFYDVSGEYYRVLVATNEQGNNSEYLGGTTSSDPGFIAPILRIWSKGYVIIYPTTFPVLTDIKNYGVRLEDGGCDGTNFWWNPIDITGSGPSVTIKNTCGGSSSDYSIFPYGVTKEP
ncbi:MAG: S8 family serine peptidase [Anaerolineaceae bacterium]|nr:S8 family serine peptidase [Anaerolineaceae bacterium]